MTSGTLPHLADSRTFCDYLKYVLSSGSGADPVAVFAVDIDQSAPVYEPLGPYLADRLMRKVAHRVHLCLPDGGFVARGLVRGYLAVATVADEDAARCLAEEVRVRVAEPVALGRRLVRLSASVGVSVYPLHAQHAAGMVRAATIALDRAARVPGGQIVIYAPDLAGEVREEFDLDQALRGALGQREFVLHYQPRIEAQSGRMVAAEALLRWSRPHAGSVPPDRFIPVAEDAGLMAGIGEWVIREACRQLSAWDLGALPALRLSVNLSPAQLERWDLPAVVAAVLREHRLPPERLELEITEGSEIPQDPASQRVLRTLKDLGVRLALDDFGAGYSSLKSLRGLPVDIVKIDRALIRGVPTDPQGVKLVQLLIEAAKWLGLTVVAEGVETQAQAELLRLLGADELQGFHFAPALPAGEVERRFGAFESAGRS